MNSNNQIINLGNIGVRGDSCKTEVAFSQPGLLKSMAIIFPLEMMY